jgi:hypothetical protein
MANLLNPLNRDIKSGDRKARPRVTSALTCKQETDFIARYLAAELRDPMLQAFEDHLKLCPDCVAFLKTYQVTMELTREFLSGAKARRLVRPLRLRKTPAKR